MALVSETSENTEKAKILIIRFSSIGDVVLTTPVIRCLKEQVYGGCELHYVILKPFVSVLENNPYIDKLHILDNNTEELIEELNNEGFHYIIDLHKNIRSHLFRRRLKVLTFTIRKLNVQKWLLVNFGIDRLPNLHIVDRYFEAVEKLNVKNDGKGLDYFIPENEEINTQEKFNADANNYLVFAIGAAHEGKKLPVHRMRVLCEKINHKVILIGGEQDIENGKKVSEGLEHIINTCGDLSINQSASVMKQARLVISHDSGMMHIAAAFKKKIISIWGATVPKFGMSAYLPHPDSVIVEAEHLKFRPTSKLGNKKTKKERRTTEEIDLNRILESVNKLW